MIENDPAEYGNPAEQKFRELTTDPQREAVDELIDGTIASPSVAREGAIDSTFSVLSHPGRRYILTYLLRSESYVTMSDLVDFVMTEVDIQKKGSAYRQKVALALTQEHLPALEDEGFVQYNLERQLVSPTEMTELVEPYLSVAYAHQQQLIEARQP